AVQFNREGIKKGKKGSAEGQDATHIAESIAVLFKATLVLTLNLLHGAESRVERLPNPPPVPNLHDWWLEVAVDLGVVGLALYVLFYVHLLTRQLRSARHTTDPLVRYLSLAGGISLIGLVVGSLDPSSMITFAPMWVIFGLGLIALAAADRARAQGGMFH